jgi:hypothetical protein
MLLSVIHNLNNSIWNKEEWNGSIVPIKKKVDKNDCNNYRGISMLSCSNERHSKVRIGKHLSDRSREMLCHHCFRI